MFWNGFDLINEVSHATEGGYVNAVISFACGIPAVENIIAGVAKASKAVKVIKNSRKDCGSVPDSRKDREYSSQKSVDLESGKCAKGDGIGCFIAGTKVKMVNGEKNIEDVEI